MEGGTDPTSEQEFEILLREAAAQRKFGAHATNVIVAYTSVLCGRGLAVIYDHEHISHLSRFRTNFLYAVANAPERFYHSYKIKKRSGGLRLISEPLPDLKILQRWMLDEIVSKLPVSKFAHAYRPGRSIKTNAKLHISREVVVKIDVVDFFGSIKVNDIFELFAKQGYTLPVASLIASLCSLGGSLPQGAPTSSALSNAFMYDFDEDVGAWALANGWRYTRYADDLTFSGKGNADLLFSIILDRFNEIGFEMNSSKSRVMRRGSRQVVCGVVVNEKMGPSREDIRKFSQEVYFISKFGIAFHLDNISSNRRNYIESLKGRGNHLLWLSSHWPDRCRKIQLLLDRLENYQLRLAG